MSHNERFPVIVVAGPTCSGKSALALTLAEAFGGTVINADSMQVYRELRILTARPGPAEMARVPHRLYGVIPAAETCSVARWRGLAEAAVAEARGAGRLPIVCGGTGLYVKALMNGLSPLPDVPADVRRAVRERHAGAETAAIYDALGRADPKASAQLAATDRQRLLRALEVFEARRLWPRWDAAFRQLVDAPDAAARDAAVKRLDALCVGENGLPRLPVTIDARLQERRLQQLATVSMALTWLAGGAAEKPPVGERTDAGLVLPLEPPVTLPLTP